MEMILPVGGRSGQSWLRLDPRTKLLLLLSGNIAVVVSPGLHYEILMAFVILLLGLLCGVYRYSIKMTVLYLILTTVQIAGTLYFEYALRAFIVTFAIFLRKLFPCAMLGGILISTTKVNELMAALQRLRLPFSIIIPLAITLRYIPMVCEEWKHVRDAMAMRGISASVWGFLKNPVRTIECVYVPMMISAAKSADELAAAAVTRGIDNPKTRSCVQRLHFAKKDVWCAVCFNLLLVAAVVWK